VIAALKFCADFAFTLLIVVTMWCAALLLA